MKVPSQQHYSKDTHATILSSDAVAKSLNCIGYTTFSGLVDDQAMMSWTVVRGDDSPLKQCSLHKSYGFLLIVGAEPDIVDDPTVTGGEMRDFRRKKNGRPTSPDILIAPSRDCQIRAGRWSQWSIKTRVP